MTAFDPIYSLSREKIREQSDPDLESVYRTISLVPTYRWGFYKNPGYMRALRERASAIFFSDFKIHPQRYVVGELPRLPFADRTFDMTLVSYLLFAYEDRFDYEFHRDAILEIMRVTRSETRLYPTLTFQAQPSEYVPMLRSDPALQAFEFVSACHARFIEMVGAVHPNRPGD